MREKILFGESARKQNMMQNSKNFDPPLLIFSIKFLAIYNMALKKPICRFLTKDFFLYHIINDEEFDSKYFQFAYSD